MKIAALEGDVDQSDVLRLVLEANGHSCETFGESIALMRRLRKERFDLLILDWHLPGLTGYEVVRWVRQNADARMPILFLTNQSPDSQSHEEDIVSGFTAGADDHMVKPLRRGELLARVNALLRRADLARNTNSMFKVGNYVVMPHARRILCNGEEIELTYKEMDLALLLFSSEGKAISREYIIEAIWGRPLPANSRTLETHLSRVRTKLGLGPDNGVQILPAYTSGYRLETSQQDDMDTSSDDYRS